MSLHTSALSAAHASVTALAPGAVDPLITDGLPSPDAGVWLNDGDDAVWIAADDPAVLLAMLDRARAAVVARFPDLAPAEPVRHEAPHATADGIVLPTSTLATWAGRPLAPADATRLAYALALSSVPDAVGTIVDAWDDVDADD